MRVVAVRTNRCKRGGRSLAQSLVCVCERRVRAQCGRYKHPLAVMRAEASGGERRQRAAAARGNLEDRAARCRRCLQPLDNPASRLKCARSLCHQTAAAIRSARQMLEMRAREMKAVAECARARARAPR